MYWNNKTQDMQRTLQEEVRLFAEQFTMLTDGNSEECMTAAEHIDMIHSVESRILGYRDLQPLYDLLKEAAKAVENEAMQDEYKRLHESLGKIDMRRSRLTNREYVIALLSDDNFVDDGGASYEAMVHYSVNCPYIGNDERAHCHGKDVDYINRGNCFYCKQEWLDKTVDI